MEVYLVKESVVERYIRAKPEFFAKIIEVDAELGEKLLAYEDKIRTYRAWIRKLEASVQGRQPEGVVRTIKEVPEWLVNTTAAHDDEKPKQRDTAARSSKKSPSKRKKTAAKSSTSRKKAK